MFDLDLSDPRFSGIATGSRLRIASCEWCSGFATIFTDVDFAGGSSWSAANPPDVLHEVGYGDLEEETWPRSGLILGAERRTPFETLGRDTLEALGMSQVGGHPEWVQYPDYPTCPTCSRRMVCVGQIAWEELEDSGIEDGITYAFLCVPCKIVATSTQQT